ncbi:MAG: FAD-dependent oxidoreductase [Gammaproteobacteria bacterium]|nr:FAD-dependent oxidoreductase [Gammaproteobacteria bacterium]
MASENLPTQAPVVVIGGGVMGCSTLYHLARAGVTDAILLERKQLTSGTTWHSAAQVRALRSTQNLTDLIRYSISLYSELEAETGQATGWINKGSLSIACNPERVVHVRRQEALAHLFGVEANWISAGEARERWPLMNADDVLGAVWSPDDGRVSPSDLCAALVKGAKARGARIFEDTPVTGIATEGGRVRAVETARGTIRCDAVALCTGLWSRATAAMAGVDVPVWPCEHFYLLTKPVEGIRGNMPTLSDHDSHLYIRDDSGGLLVGCFEPMGKAIDPAALGEDFAFGLLDEDWDHFEPMLMNAMHRLPVLESAEIRMLLNGPESFTPDGSFLLGESAETRGFYLGCGMNSVGVATGGGAGMALAHNIVEGQLPYDMHEADPKRYPGCWNNVKHLAERVPEALGKHYEITFPGRQYVTARDLARGPLHEEWLAAGAHFGQFYGYERPLYFGKSAEPVLTFGRPDWFDRVGEEVRAATESAAIFDLSTFGKIRVTGADAETFLNRVCANDMARPPGRAIYTSMLNQNGGIESDLTALRLGDADYRLYVGTTAIKRDLAWLRRHLATNEQVELSDETDTLAVLGLMGPRAGEIVAGLGAAELRELGYFRHAPASIDGVDVIAARLSYVGEAGWELTCRATDAAALYRALAARGVRPAGLFAQTSMRIEKRFLAYGHELDTDVDPLQAGLEFALGWDTPFIGRDALLDRRDNPPAKRIVSLVFDDTSAVPLGNEPVYAGGTIVGKTTSAAFGYRVGRPVALASIDAAHGAAGPAVTVDVGGQRYAAAVTMAAAFDPDGRRMRAR